jgi:hypothetical protein
VILAEIAQGEAVEVPAVGRVAKGAEIGVVGSNDEGSSAGLEETVKLLHQADYVSDVLNDVNGTYFAETAVAKGKRDVIEVSDDIGVRVRVSIDADGAGVFFDAAADI